MAYDDDTRSVSSSAPKELYEFITPTVTYRLTSGDVDIVYDGNIYTATAGLSRSATELTTVIDNAQEVDVQVPASHAFVQQNVFGKLPRSINCKIYILEPVSGEAKLVWEGRVAAISVAKQWASVLVPLKIDQALAVEIPSVRFQPLCNHILYDARCRMLRVDPYSIPAVVSAIAGNTVTVGSVAGSPDQWFRAGEIIRTIDGERRMVMEHTDLALRIEYPFRALFPADAVTLIAGCDHTPETCRDKFGNIANFGGHPHVSARWVRMPRDIEGT